MVSSVPVDPTGQQMPYLGESRSRVLHALQASTEPMGVSEIARKVGLHPNTARFHLDALTDSRLAERHREDRDAPGRPRWLYSAGPNSGQRGRRSYQLLAQILSSTLAMPAADPRANAVEAGEQWGRKMVQAPARGKHTDAGEATRQLCDTLDQIGFAPEVSPGKEGTRVLLHHCPFREAVATNQEVVCAVHLGLMRGVLKELNTGVRAASLEPFVKPELCITQLVEDKAAS